MIDGFVTFVVLAPTFFIAVLLLLWKNDLKKGLTLKSDGTLCVIVIKLSSRDRLRHAHAVEESK